MEIKFMPEAEEDLPVPFLLQIVSLCAWAAPSYRHHSNPLSISILHPCRLPLARVEFVLLTL